MEELFHDKFWKRFWKVGLIFIPLIALGMGGVFWVFHLGDENLAVALGMVAMLAAFVLMGVFFYMLHHVSCAKCDSRCRTVKDEQRKLWLAECDKCGIRWNLGIGTETSRDN